MEKYTINFNIVAKEILEHVFWNDFDTHFSKTLWRMSKGNRLIAFRYIRYYIAALNKVDNRILNYKLNNSDLDYILGELNGGAEIEWNS